MTASQTAFEDAPVTIQAEVAARGFPGEQVDTRLIEVTSGAFQCCRGTKTNRRRGGRPTEFPVSNTARQTGPPFLRSRDAGAERIGRTGGPGPREATLVNNRKMAVVDRGQEPFRVLYVGGRPTWYFKFLNRAIAYDPQVQLVGLIRMARRAPKFEFAGGELSNPLFGGFGDTNEETARYDQPRAHPAQHAGRIRIARRLPGYRRGTFSSITRSFLATWKRIFSRTIKWC